MQIGDTKSFKKALAVFFVVAGVLQLVGFGSYYLGRYGLSVAPKADGLWWTFYQAADTSARGAIAAAATVYIGARCKDDESKSKDAA